MSPISKAVVLMAGEGSRFRESGKSFLKPFVSVANRPLISYTLDILARAEIENVYFVVGHKSREVIMRTKRLIPEGLDPHFIENRERRKGNGVSLLTAAKHVGGPFLLTMSDHLFDSAIVDLLMDLADCDLLNVAVDRKLDSIFDLADAMKVQIRGDRLIAIGKNLRDYNAIDTGVFICPPAIFDYLARAKSASPDNDCSLADGVRLMAAAGRVRAVDIANAWWQDVDTPQMLHQAEAKIKNADYALNPG